jgi:hypothetical protein
MSENKENLRGNPYYGSCPKHECFDCWYLRLRARADHCGGYPGCQKDNKEFTFQLLILQNAMSIFREYTNKRTSKDLPKDQKEYIKELITAWNNYKDEPMDVQDIQVRNAEIANEIKDDTFQIYRLAYSLLIGVYKRYKHIFAIGKLTEKEALKYIKATHAYAKGVFIRGAMPTCDLHMSGIIIHFEKEWIMNKPIK